RYSLSPSRQPAPHVTRLDSSGALLRHVDQSVIREFSESRAFQSLAAASFSFSHELTGRIFLVEPKLALASEEELGFFQELVRQITPAIYNLYLLRRLRSRAGAVERARLVRELHDG